MTFPRRLCGQIVVVISLAGGFSLAAKPLRSDPLESAKLLVADLKPERNLYSYDDMYIKWKGVAGATQYEARCDCSGFLSLLLEHCYGLNSDSFKRWTGHSRPTVRVYHDQIESEHGFKKVKEIGKIQPGDIIAVKYLEKSKDTGHVMIVAEAPRPRAESEPMEPGTRQWDVVVIDSSKSGHGADDTRRQPDKTYATGIGQGVLRLYSNPAGEVVGYTWSTQKKSAFFGPQQHHVVIGRLDPAFKF